MKQYFEQILKKLQPHGPITGRAMFGGYGIYWDKIIFASIVEGRLYFRVDGINRKDYEKYNAQPFVYGGGKKPVVMPYLTLPEEILEDPKKLVKWIEKARDASIRYKSVSSKKTKKRRTSI